MALVSYSESEGSEDEKSGAQPQDDHVVATKPGTKFTVDKSNPRKIRVNLQEIKAEYTIDGGPDKEPDPKRPKVGGGFSGFNSILPAPKRDPVSTHGLDTASKSTSRKVFSLKTGAEPGFSKESDAELRQLFANQSTNDGEAGHGDEKFDRIDTNNTGREWFPPPVSHTAAPKQNNHLLFKPLSVATGIQSKKRRPNKTPAVAVAPQASSSNIASCLENSASTPRIKLFTIGNKDQPHDTPGAHHAYYEPIFHQGAVEENSHNSEVDSNDQLIAGLHDPVSSVEAETQAQTLDSIAVDLNLSASAKRQLFGRNHKDASKISSSIINFNTDQEYAANEALRASGEQAQHHPVRAIAPGKHSLKQLVNAASGQKEALEESFASGRRNKKEAGSKYGW